MKGSGRMGMMRRRMMVRVSTWVRKISGTYGGFSGEHLRKGERGNRIHY
jgi:hypothetical protein